MIVISDMGGTLTSGWPVIGLVKWVRHNQSAARATLYLARYLPHYLFAKLGLTDTQKLGQRLMFTALNIIKNPTQENLRDMGRWSVEYELWPKRRQDVLSRLAGHMEDGAQVFIASSVYLPTVEAFANRIGARAIGTPLEIANGRLRFAESLTAEDRKAEEVLKRLGVERVDAAYGDTWADIPLLEIADKPVAVYPDSVLKSIALERGWEIMGDRLRKP